MQGAHIEDKSREGCLRWSGHCLGWPPGVLVYSCDVMCSKGVKEETRCKITWKKVVSKGVLSLGIYANLARR